MTHPQPSRVEMTKGVELPVADLEAGGYWAVLDATDSPLIPSLVHYSNVTIECLYKNKAAEDMAEIAPYLVRLDKFMYLWIKDNIWSEPWGMAFYADVDLKDIHRHLRKFLMVQDESGKMMWFRYYDPRVLPAFLDSCTPEELAKFCGPVSRYWCRENDDTFVRLDLV